MHAAHLPSLSLDNVEDDLDNVDSVLGSVEGSLGTTFKPHAQGLVATVGTCANCGSGPVSVFEDWPTVMAALQGRHFEDCGVAVQEGTTVEVFWTRAPCKLCSKPVVAVGPASDVRALLAGAQRR